MLIMAISEMLCLPVTCFISGYFSLTGRMFCNSPLLIYVSGIFGFGELFFAVEDSLFKTA
jgi:hypothetical protein